MADTIKEVLTELSGDSFDASINNQEDYAQVLINVEAEALADIKRIIEEAKPTRVLSVDPENSRRARAYQMAIDDYHDNLVKALEG